MAKLLVRIFINSITNWGPLPFKYYRKKKNNYKIYEWLSNYQYEYSSAKILYASTIRPKGNLPCLHDMRAEIMRFDATAGYNMKFCYYCIIVAKLLINCFTAFHCKNNELFALIGKNTDGCFTAITCFHSRLFNLNICNTKNKALVIKRFQLMFRIVQRRTLHLLITINLQNERVNSF